MNGDTHFKSASDFYINDDYYYCEKTNLIEDPDREEDRLYLSRFPFGKLATDDRVWKTKSKRASFPRTGESQSKSIRIRFNI